MFSMENHYETPITPSNKRTTKTPNKTPSKGDRFIPNRSAMDIEISHFNLMKENANPNMCSPSKEEYREKLAESLFEGRMTKDAKILAFKNKAPAPKEGTQNGQRVLYSCNKNTVPTGKSVRHIPQKPEKILDAPSISDDYYLNLIDWSKTNILAIGLGATVYLWNASNGETTELMKTCGEGEEISNPICSVNWTAEGKYIAVGLNDGSTQLWDTESQKPLRNLTGHSARVGCLAWNSHILSTGSKDSTIFQHDVRIAQHHIGTLANHTQEVCGLKWSDDGTTLASGGNDNVVNIWDVERTSPKFTFTEHQAAVKALAWCPFQKDLLATGGGTSDRTIKFWNTSSGSLLNSIDTQSQVSSLVWSKNPNCREIVSSHGFAQNQLIVWKYPSLVRVAELRGHENRILSLAQSPDGSVVASAGADETLRFWKIFEAEAKPTKTKQEVRSSSSLTRTLNIR